MPRDGKTLDEWKAEYQKRTGEPFAPEEDEHVFYSADRGLMSFAVNRDDSALELGFVVGDGRFWFRQVQELLKSSGMKRARFFTRRDPKAAVRKFGPLMKVSGYWMEIEVQDEDKI